MAKQKSEMRDKIIKTTTELIKKYGDTNLITVREIATAAGVGIGLVNYHFQTKENLINICIMELIGQSVLQLQSAPQNEKIQPKEMFIGLCKGIAAFMAQNPGLSMISIKKDLTSPDSADNMSQLGQMLLPVLTEVYGESKDKKELLVLLQLLISSISVAFLRNSVTDSKLEIDFMNEAQRDSLLEYCIHRLFYDLPDR